MDEYFLLNKMYNTVKKNLSMKTPMLMREINKFVDARSEILNAIGPSKQLYFSDAEREKMVSCMGLTLDEIQKYKDQCPVQEGWFQLDKPFHIACVLAIKYYSDNKKKKEMQYMILMLALSRYTSIYYSYFRFEPNENIMAYTINNMSNKYKIKQLGSLLNAIVYTVNNAHETYEECIDDCSDLNLRKYIVNMNTRINGFIRNIAKEFYDNHAHGRYLNTETDDYSETNFKATENNSLIITRIADQISYNIVSAGLSSLDVERSAKAAQISVVALKNAIMEITAKYDQEIREIVTCIIRVYLEEGHPARSIRSSQFLASCNSMYLKSNTVDASIIRIKQLLDKWLTDCSPNYTKTERVATKNNFRRALFLYFVFRIMITYKG